MYNSSRFFFSCLQWQIHKLVLFPFLGGMRGPKNSVTAVGLRAWASMTQATGGKQANQVARAGHVARKSPYVPLGKKQKTKTKKSGKSKRHQTQQRQEAEGVFTGQASAAFFSPPLPPPPSTSSSPHPFLYLSHSNAISITISRGKAQTKRFMRGSPCPRWLTALKTIALSLSASRILSRSLPLLPLFRHRTEKKNVCRKIALFKYWENHLHLGI